MRSSSWAIPEDDTVSFDFIVRWAKDRGMTAIEVKRFVFVRITSPEPLGWWITKPLPFRVRAHVPATLWNTSTQTIRVLNDGREMDVIARSFPMDYDLQVWTNLWISHKDCEPL